MKQTTKKAVAIALGTLVLGGVGGAIAGANLFPQTITKEVPGPEKEIIKEVPGPVQIREVEVEVPVATFVDNGRMDEVLKFILERRGDISFITEDLDDGEAAQIADLVILANDYADRAINHVRDAGIRELHNENVGDTELDKDDIKSFKVEDDDIVFDVLDMPEGDLDIMVPVRFRQDDERFDAVFRVRFIDGELDELEIESLELVE